MPILMVLSRGEGKAHRRVSIVAVSVLLYGGEVLSLGCSKSDTRNPDTARIATPGISSCPTFAGSTSGWRRSQTSDGRASLLMPSTYVPVRIDSGQMWASDVASVGYRVGEPRVRDTMPVSSPENQLCTERTGDTGRLSYYHAQAATGEGHYLQALFSMADGTTIRLIGFVRDPADGTELLAIARGVRLAEK